MAPQFSRLSSSDSSSDDSSESSDYSDSSGEESSEDEFDASSFLGTLAWNALALAWDVLCM